LDKDPKQSDFVLRQLLENSPLAVIEWDREARVSRWSESAERLFGWQAEEVLGKHVSDWHFVFDDDIDAVAQVTYRQRVGTELHGMLRNRNYTRDGSVLYCEWYNSVLTDEAGNLVSVLSLVLDVSARKLAEEERANMLGRERDLRKRAEEADRLKDEFLATLSHELRTPLTSILGWASLIRTGDIDEDNVANAIRIIERNARSQARLIDDLLDVSRIITGKLQLDVHPVNMAPLVEAAKEALRPAADAKGIQVETDVEAGSCFVSGDPNRLSQVIWNLLMNAIKFTPRGGKVHVRLECIGQSPMSNVQRQTSVPKASSDKSEAVSESPLSTGASLNFDNSLLITHHSSPDNDPSPASYVRLTLSDTGEGIKREFLPYVFHRFRQEESSISRKAGGLGLGLAVVRHLVELHGGNVSADSAGPGQGSTFIVEIPVACNTLKTPELRDTSADKRKLGGGVTDSSGRANLDGIRVLLVEDDDDSRILLRVLLERRGAEVIAASSSAEALKWFTRQVSEVGVVKEGSIAFETPNVQSQTGVGNPQAEIGSLPHIIISDLGMPEEDGYELMRKIRLLSPYSSLIGHHSLVSQGIPAIAFTGYASAKDRERALLVGYQLHLAKPVEPEELVTAILNLLGTTSSES
jgi:PAS domain S-box-containing protein